MNWYSSYSKRLKHVFHHFLSMACFDFLTWFPVQQLLSKLQSNWPLRYKSSNMDCIGLSVGKKLKARLISIIDFSRCDSFRRSKPKLCFTIFCVILKIVNFWFLNELRPDHLDSPCAFIKGMCYLYQRAPQGGPKSRFHPSFLHESRPEIAWYSCSSQVYPITQDARLIIYAIT